MKLPASNHSRKKSIWFQSFQNALQSRPVYFESLNHELKVSYEDASTKKLIVTLFPTFDILLHFAKVINLLWWPLQPPGLISSSLISLSVHFSSFHFHISFELHGSGIIEASDWEYSLHFPWRARCLILQKNQRPRVHCIVFSTMSSSAFLLDFFNLGNT